MPIEQERAHGRARPATLRSRLRTPKVSQETKWAILAARAEGKGINRIATDLSMGSSTVRRTIAENKAQ